MMAASISAHHSRQLEENPQHNIRSSWSVRHAAGEPFAVVRVRNLQTAVQGPHDAWGREGKLQPLLVSAELSFNSPFGTAVADDKVTGGDTVHYGSLSKTILATVDSINHLAQTGRAQVQRDHAALMALKDQPTLMSLLQAIWLGLTGSTVDGAHANQDIMSSVLVDVSRLRFMSLTVCLPKASLLGEAVSLTASSVFETDSNGQSTVPMFGISLQLHKLRVPTLIGVNDNERLAKQFVVTDVEIDRCICGTDVYTTLESLIVKVLCFRV